VPADGEGEAGFGGEDVVAEILRPGLVDDGFHELHAVAEFVLEAFGETQGEVVVLHALFFPEVARAGFEGQLGGVVLDKVVAEVGPEVHAVVHVGELIMEEVAEQAEIEAVGEQVVVIGGGAQGIAVHHAAVFAVEVTRAKVELVRERDVGGEDFRVELKVVAVAPRQVQAGGCGHFPWAFRRGSDGRLS
jgi:hypothetical protein